MAWPNACHLGECSTAACTSPASTLDGTVCRRECPLIAHQYLHDIYKVTLEKVSLHLSTLFTFTCCIWSTSTKLIACTLVTISSHEGVVGLHCIACYNLRSCFISDVHCIFGNMGIYMYWDTIWFGVCWRKRSIPLQFNHRWILWSNFQILGWGEGACV